MKGVALARGDGFRFTSHKPKCLGTKDKKIVESVVFFMDDNENEVPKGKATMAHVLEIYADGTRNEALLSRDAKGKERQSR